MSSLIENSSCFKKIQVFNKLCLKKLVFSKYKGIHYLFSICPMADRTGFAGTSIEIEFKDLKTAWS